MLGQSSGQSPRASTSSRPSALSASGPNTPPLVDSNESTIPTRKWALERPEEGVVASGLAEDELQHRRRKPRSSGGFLLQTARVPPSQSRFSWNGTSEGIQDVKGKRRAEEGDLTVPKRAIARQGQHRKPSLGSSPLATEVLNIQHVDHGNADESTGSDKSSSAHTKSRQRLGSGLNSNGISTESTLNGDQPRQAGGERAFGQDTDPALIVNLALNLSESRRRNFSSGGLLIPRDAVGTRRIISSGYPTLASSNSTNVASLRQYLQQPHQLTQNVSPRLGKSGSNRGTGSPLSQDDYTRSWQSTMLPAFEAGLSDKVVFDACDATFSRAEKARVALELSYEYRRLLQYLPAVPTNPKSKQNLSKSAAKQHVGLSDHLSMTYNPLQYIRNRKVRFRERRPLDAERDGWKHIERVRRWVDVVADNREDGIHRADRRFPLPPFEPMKKCEPPRTDGIQSPDIPLSAGARSKESGRPRMDWEVTSWDLLADAYWLQQGDNMYHIEDSSGQKIMQRYGIRKETTSRASIESNRSFGRRSKSMVKESVSPERVQALAASIRQDSLERGRRGRGTNEPKPPSHDGNGSQDRKGMWSKRFVRSRSSSTSSDSIRDKRRRHGRGRDLAGSHEDLHTAALEKQMMDMLAKEAEHNRGSLQDSNDEFQTAAEDDSDQHYRGTTRNSIPYFTKRRPSAPQRMMTEMPVTEKTQIPARTSLDEQRLHHRKSSDDFDSTAPNSPTATGFVPSIAINLSPPASPPKSAVSPKKMLPSRLGSFKRNRSRSISRRAASNCDPTVKASTMSDVSRQTTNESHYRNRPTMERSTDPDNGLLSPVKIDPPGNNYRPIGGNPMTMIKTASGPESKIRGMFKRGRIAELLGNEVSKVGGMLWNKDSNNSASTHSSPISSYASEDSDLDDEDMSGFDNSPKDDMSPFTISNEMMGKPAQVSTRIDEPKYHMSNLPSFRLPFNRDYPSLEPMKISPDHDPVTRQQLAQRERGRSSRFDRLAPPKIDMEKVSPLPSRNTSPVGLHGRGAHNEGSHGSSSGRSDHRVRSADRRLNAMLGIPGKVGTGLPAPTGLSAFESRPRESPEPPNLGEKRQWTISDQGVSAVHGTINRRDIARVRALLLSSGVKANEIARRAEEVPDEPSQLLQNLQGSLKGLVPNVARSQEHTVVARLLINKIETTTKQLRSDAEVFSHTTVETLHDQSKAIDEHVTYKLTPLVRAFADDADSFSAELTTTHTLAVKQLNDRVNAILRARRRRLRRVERMMLRQALPIARRAVTKPIGLRYSIQWSQTRQNQKFLQRSFAESRPLDPNTKPSIHDSDAIVLPGTQSSTATSPQPAPAGPVLSASSTAPSPATPASDTSIPPQNVPLMPPAPPGGKTQTAPPTAVRPQSGTSPIPPTTPPTYQPTAPSTPPPTSTAPPPPPPPSRPPPPKRKRRWFRSTLVLLVLTSALGFAGGTFYSLRSDNFHDFFTEYIPFGEDAVLYFEEKEFRRRFPNLTNPSNRPLADTDSKITIPSRSGVSWKVAGQEHQGSDSQSKGRHMSALDANDPGVKAEHALQSPSTAKVSEKNKAVEQVKKETSPPKTTAPGDKPKSSPPPPPSPAIEAKKPAPAPAPAPPKPADPPKDAPTRPPEVNEPSRYMPMEHIDPLKIRNAEEPLVQDLVKIINDIITVVNDDGASHKYSSTIDKAKASLADVGGRIMALKASERKIAQDKIKSTQVEFDTAAQELVRRLEVEMRDQEGRWKEEFESERERISQSYQERLQTETQRVQQVSEQRLRNELLEQAIAMKKQFMSEVTDRVETERNGRLSKLSDLSSNVTELEKLTADWNSVIDANLKTQHLQVAVEAVRSSLETADRPRPFIKELSALKEIASNDSVVNAAIGSINPTAYQRGIPTTAQLIDRFRRVAAEVRKASLLPDDAGVASHAASFVLSKFMFKKKGMTVGDDVESILTRTETLLEEGNLDEAAREINTLNGWAKTLSWDWLSECRRVLEVRQAMDVIATEARLEGLKVD